MHLLILTSCSCSIKPVIAMEERMATSRVHKSCGTFTFRIEGYGGLSTRVGESAESPEFELCDHLWQLRIFPGGSLDVHRGYLSFYLASKSTRTARASYKLLVCNQSGGVDESFASSGVRVFEAKGIQIDGWGRDKFMPIATLMNPEKGFYVNDVVILKTEITVYNDLIHEETLDNPNTIAVKNQSLAKCMKTLLKEELLLGDINFIFTKHKMSIKAHRCILMARSPVFKAMFNSQMSETVSGDVYVEDLEPNVMKELLAYMYTDAFSNENILPTMAEELLIAATKYDIVGVTFECEAYLIQQICPETVIGLIALADVCSASSLKHQCLAFIASQVTDLSTLPDCAELKEELVMEVQEAIQQNSKSCSAKTAIQSDKKASICSLM